MMSPERRYFYNIEYYKKNEVRLKDYQVSFRAKRHAFLKTLKDKPCMDCEIKYPFCAMEFDHRDKTTKVNNVGSMMRCSEAQILNEVAKCDLVCSNCHSIRTWNRSHSIDKQIIFSKQVG